MQQAWLCLLEVRGASNGANKSSASNYPALLIDVVNNSLSGTYYVPEMGVSNSQGRHRFVFKWTVSMFISSYQEGKLLGLSDLVRN